jgi:hypothetical protein
MHHRRAPRDRASRTRASFRFARARRRVEALARAELLEIAGWLDGSDLDALIRRRTARDRAARSWCFGSANSTATRATELLPHLPTDGLYELYMMVCAAMLTRG